jgi:nucleoid-associated protein YgaU
MRRYINSEILKNEDGKGFFASQYIPDFPESDKDVFIVTKSLDRFDNLAYKYYGDQTLWWVIAKANKLINGHLIPGPGIYLRIPDPTNEIFQRMELVMEETNDRT